MKKGKGFYSISVVAKMFEVHQQTIRMYEKEGLISPKRSEGNTRLFSQEDVDRLEEVIYLTHKLGVNLAGVQMILRLKKKIARMQEDMNKAFEKTQEQLKQEAGEMVQDIKRNASRVAAIKQDARAEHRPRITRSKKPELPAESPDVDDWQIDYDEK